VGLGASDAVPGSCVSIGKALAAATGWSTLDGGLIDGTTMVGTGTLPPCFDPVGVTVTIGGKDFTGAAIAYAGVTSIKKRPVGWLLNDDPAEFVRDHPFLQLTISPGNTYHAVDDSWIRLCPVPYSEC